MEPSGGNSATGSTALTKLASSSVHEIQYLERDRRPNGRDLRPIAEWGMTVLVQGTFLSIFFLLLSRRLPLLSLQAFAVLLVFSFM
jgi:hypothetical protein